MDEKLLKNTVAESIIRLRKIAGLTQLELAERLHYSDKSISKWERGEGLPDLVVLMQMAELFGVPIGEIVCGAPPRLQETPVSRRGLLTLLIAVLIAFVAGFGAYSVAGMFFPAFGGRWVLFLFSALASAILTTVFACAWGRRKLRLIGASLIIWTAAVAGFFVVPWFHSYYTFIMAALIQALTLLIFLRRDGIACLPFVREK